MGGRRLLERCLKLKVTARKTPPQSGALLRGKVKRGGVFFCNSFLLWDSRNGQELVLFFAFPLSSLSLQKGGDVEGGFLQGRAPLSTDEGLRF